MRGICDVDVRDSLAMASEAGPHRFTSSMPAESGHRHEYSNDACAPTEDALAPTT